VKRSFPLTHVKAQQTSHDPELKIVGGMAVALGIVLALATLIFEVSGTNVLLSPSPMTVGALAFIFIFTGIGVCESLRAAAIILSVAFLGLAFAQTVAAFSALVPTRAIEHALFAVWLWIEPSVLWHHRNELK
jgi:hypothetical protein